MQKYKSNITTTSGAAVRGVPVLVIDEDGNNAALFLDRAGTVPAPNPLTTGQDGVFYFYAVNGRYSIRTTVDGVTITDADVVLLMDPEEITVAGPIAEAVAAAQAAAIAAEFSVEASGIPNLVAAAQNAVVDANNAVSQSSTAASNAATSKTGADSARDAAVIAKNAAEAALDSFDDRYLGAKAVAPTTDNDGGDLLTGALYWDTSLPGMRSWNGGAWVTLPAATKASVGLANVDNTSDAAKSVLSATKLTTARTINGVSFNGSANISINAAAISNTPAGSIAATTVQAAINELDAEKVRVDALAAPSGSSLVGYLPAGVGAVATTVQAKLREVVSVLDFGAVGDGVTDDAAAIQAAVNASKYVFFPPASSYYKTLSTITIPLGRHLIGAQQPQTIIGAWGCDAFTINGASGDHVTIEGMEFRGYSALGVIDAKTHTGVKSCGTGADHVNYLKIRSCFFRGWRYCIDWQYTWNSTLDDVDTLNCTNGLRLFGQSVNNSIVKSRIGANGGNASILAVKDGAIKGEGLMVAGSLLASGNFGISSDGFLSLSVVGCVVDLIQDKAFDLTNCPAFTLSSSWVYAENFGVNFNDLGVSVDQGASITGCYITVAAASGRAVNFGGNNKGLSIIGGALTCGTSGRLVYSDGNGVSVVGVNGVNTGANPSILFAGLDCVARANTGSMAVQWGVGVQSQGGVAVATLSFNGLTGAALFANGCSIIRTGVGAYSVTFTYPLVSASYMPMVTLDRGGNGAMGYAIVSQSTTGFSFTVTNAAGTPNDVTVGWIAVFN